MPPVATPISAPVAPGIPGAAPVVAKPNNGSTSGINGNYFKSPNETTDQYTARVAAYNAANDPDASKVASEPAILSSSSVDDEIATAKGKLATMTQKGSTIDPSTGTISYADGSAAAAPATDATTTEDPYSVDKFYGDGTDANPGDADWAATKNLFAPLKANLDADTLSQVNAIEQQYDSLRTLQTAANTNASKSRLTALLNAGGRYAPADTSGVLLATTSYGLQRIQALDSQENMAMAQAKTAQEQGDMQLMTSAISMAEAARKDKQTAAAKVAETLQAAQKVASDKAMQSSRDSAVASLVQQGVTDPKQLLGYLNFDDKGNPTGDFTADEVATTLKNLTVAGTDPKDLSADLKTFEYIKDNIGLPDEIASLPPEEQYFAYLAMVKKANTAPPKAVTPKSTPTDSTDAPLPAWEDYKAAAMKAMGVSYLMAADEDKLKAQYDADSAAQADEKPFTATELKKLEQAGLAGATRQEKLDFLYGKKPASSSGSGGNGGTTDIPTQFK